MEKQEELCNEILNSIENLINKGNLEDAKHIIEKYEEKIKFDTKIYSMKAIINIIEGNFEKAEDILLKGLVLDICNFDLLYNLAYTYEMQENYIKATYFYNYARLYCKDDNYKNEIENKIDNIQINNVYKIKESTYRDDDESNEFIYRLVTNLLKNSNEYHIDNVDYDRFGDNANNIYIYNPNEKKYISEKLNEFKYLFNRLNDKKSKDILVNIISYRILGNKKIKLPLSNKQYFIDRKNVDKLIKDKDSLKINFMNWNLSYFEINEVGYPIKIYYLSGGVYNTFVLKQYNYCGESIIIKPEKNDIVIDAGGCFGDTALRFAYDVGKDGRVYTFEFMPSNLEIMNKNIEANKEVSEAITIIEKPLHSKTGEKFYCRDNGPGSSISSVKKDKNDICVTTVSIDDFVLENKVNKIDFIKMDIEGAELAALVGATNTIKKYKPKLAISLYHNISDFIEIYKYIDSLGLGYKFYLDHYTIFLEETVLYTIIE